MKSMVEFLTKFRRVVEILSSDKSCTINLALLLKSELEDVLKEDENDSIVVGELKRRLLARLDFRYPVDDLLVTSAILDPSCCDLLIVDKYLRERGMTKAEYLAQQVRLHVLESHLPQEAQQHHEETPADDAHPAQPGPSTGRTTKRKSNTAEEVLTLSRKHSKNKDGTRAAAIDREIRQYLDACNPSDVTDNDILAYWRRRINQYPWLTTAVRRFLCVPATSTTAERVFSIAGLTVTAKRSRLHPDRVDIVIFIHENYEVCRNLFASN
ncbi:E3 SUMO-protein ligase ZBED1-like [Frankliniella occidentalis]|uniref:E3 SUMO-protein ligase ZBED1-like n=1 Tax=Frankliniella occidentalis TaxID=133901 RepID=A0A9C6WZN9_FRAOC|nr:E3 SUMO-protein ligase ZBED1-like [Frankliniella occidentalis]